MPKEPLPVIELAPLIWKLFPDDAHEIPLPVLDVMEKTPPQEASRKEAPSDMVIPFVALLVTITVAVLEQTME